MNSDTLQAVIEAVEFYLENMKSISCTQASIDYYTEILYDLVDQLKWLNEEVALIKANSEKKND